MWFKQFSWFDLQSPFLLEGEALEDALLEKKAYKPHATQMKSIGWESPMGQQHPLAVTIPGYTWMVARLDQKLLPSNVVNNLLKERLVEIEEQQGYPVTSKQKRMQRDDLILELLPKAFVQSKRVHVVVDHQQQVLLMDQCSAGVKDMVVDLLKQTLGSFSMTHHLELKSKSSQILKSWVSQPPEGIDIESEYSLINPNNVHVKARMVGLEDAMVMAPLESGMSVSQLMVRYKDVLKFQISDQLNISRIKYLSMEEVEKLEDPVEQLVTEFTLSIHLIAELIASLKEWFPTKVVAEEVEEACSVE